MYESTTEAITTEGVDVEIDLTVRGDEDKAEKVKMHAHDEIVRALQAFETGEHPRDCEGFIMSVAWDRVLGDDDE